MNLLLLIQDIRCMDLLATNEAAVHASPDHVEKIIAMFRESQEAVNQQWEYRPDIMCTAATVHGRMNKTTSGRYTLTMPESIMPYVDAGVPIYTSAQVCPPQRTRYHLCSIPLDEHRSWKEVYSLCIYDTTQIRQKALLSGICCLHILEHCQC